MLVLWFILISFFEHPYFVSHTNIVYEKKEIQITSEFFLDDFENALMKEFPQEKLDFSHENNKTQELVKNFFKNNVSLQIDKKNIEYIFLGYEIENGNIYCYANKIGVDQPLQSITIKNSLLYKTKETQTHILSLKIGQKEFHSRIQNPIQQHTFILNQ